MLNTKLKNLNSFFFLQIIFILVWLKYLLNYILINISYFNIYLSLIVTVYFFFNLFYYFLNINMYSNYTTALQRFWKRTFMLFWIIEGFLFFIFIYLILISPEETYIFINNNEKFNFYLDYDFLKNVIIILTLIYFNYYLKYNIKNNTRVVSTLLCLLYIFSLYIIIEFFKFFNNFFSIININTLNNILNHSYNIFIPYTSYSNTNYVLNCTTNIKNRTVKFYIFLIIFLKFWHILYVFLLYYLFCTNALLKNKGSFDISSYNYQSIIYLFFFLLTSLIFYYKIFFFPILKTTYTNYTLQYNCYTLVNNIFLETFFFFSIVLCIFLI